jgi:hypothetical protein
MKVALSAAVLLIGSAVWAAEPTEFWSNEGDIYFGSISESGAVLTSKYPKSWFHGEPNEDLQVHTKPAVIIFAPDCDAHHNEYGRGTWSGANGGFGASFEDHRISFGRQELFGDQFAKCYAVQE